MVDIGELELEYVPTSNQIADVLTEGPSCGKNKKFSIGVGIYCLV